MIATLEQIADLVDGFELREIDEEFDDKMSDRFLEATEHLYTVLSDEADEIYLKVEREVIIEYLRERFATPVEPVVPIN